MIEGGNASKFAIFQNASMYPVKGASEKIWLFGEMWHGLWRHEVGVASQGGMTCLLFRSAA